MENARPNLREGGYTMEPGVMELTSWSLVMHFSWYSLRDGAYLMHLAR